MHSRFKKALIVDDDELDIYVSRRIMKSSSFADVVITTTTVKDALDYLAHNTSEGSAPEIIFLDLNMPGQNGLDFLEQYVSLSLKNKNQTATVALLMNVTNAEDVITRKAKMHPLVKYVFEKPLTGEMLRSI